MSSVTRAVVATCCQPLSMTRVGIELAKSYSESLALLLSPFHPKADTQRCVRQSALKHDQEDEEAVPMDSACVTHLGHIQPQDDPELRESMRAALDAAWKQVDISEMPKSVFRTLFVSCPPALCTILKER